MSDERKSLGRQGEDVACRYLQNRGYTILERNFRCRLGELDLIARTGRELCFIEVKTRRDLSYGPPCLAVTPKKQETIRRLSHYYLSLHPAYRVLQPRLDVLELLARDGTWYVRYLPAAF